MALHAHAHPAPARPAARYLAGLDRVLAGMADDGYRAVHLHHEADRHERWRDGLERAVRLDDRAMTEQEHATLVLIADALAGIRERLAGLQAGTRAAIAQAEARMTRRRR